MTWKIHRNRLQASKRQNIHSNERNESRLHAQCWREKITNRIQWHIRLSKCSQMEKEIAPAIVIRHWWPPIPHSCCRLSQVWHATSALTMFKPFHNNRCLSFRQHICCCCNNFFSLRETNEHHLPRSWMTTGVIHHAR